MRLATLFLLAFASPPAAAQEAKAPDLAGLRESVAAAAKRGANVTEVVLALDALERSLAKGFAPRPGGAAPAELKALRDAVETAGARGEKVDGVRAEHDRVEVAMTGKAFERPKPVPVELPQPAARPEPNPFGRRGGIVIQGGGAGNVVIRGGANGVVIRGAQIGGRGGRATTITLTGNEFVIKALQDGVQYVVEGTIGEDGPVVEEVSITEGDKKPVEFKSLKDVPDAHRPAVEKLLKTVSRG
ncbi:MAG TPA: hypothetical protein VM529_17905 [Gemmata sp.]|nr:hypothetical protein [Gemmata sp.]